MKNKIDFKKLMDNSTFLLIFSLVSAVLIWYGVVSQDRDATTTVRNVPVVLDTENSSLETLGLDPVGRTEYSVDVEIEGLRSAVGTVRPEDLKVVAKASNVLAPGEYELALEGFDSRNQGIIIKDIIPKTVKMRFDHFIEKTFPIERDLKSLSVAKGYILNQVSVSPAEVTLKGPSAEIGKIDRAVIKKEFKDALSQTVSYTEKISFVDADGNDVILNNVEFSETESTVTLPVLKKKKVPVNIDLIGTPPGFDENSIEFEKDPEYIEIAGPVSSINNISEIHLGYVDLRILEPDMLLTYEVKLPPGYISIENINSVDLEFVSQDIDEKIINVTEVNVTNAPVDYDISVQTKTFYGVKVYGDKDELNKVSSKNVIAEIDMAEIDIKDGTYTVPVSFAIADCESCWVYGNEYNAVITVKER